MHKGVERHAAKAAKRHAAKKAHRQTTIEHTIVTKKLQNTVGYMALRASLFGGLCVLSKYRFSHRHHISSCFVFHHFLVTLFFMVVVQLLFVRVCFVRETIPEVARDPKALKRRDLSASLLFFVMVLFFF